MYAGGFCIDLNVNSYQMPLRFLRLHGFFFSAKKTNQNKTKNDQHLLLGVYQDMKKTNKKNNKKKQTNEATADCSKVTAR